MMNEIKPESFQITDYLHKTFTCSCGRQHSTILDEVIIERGALSKIPALMNKYRYRKIFLIADAHTYQAAGRTVEESLLAAGCTVKKYVFQEEELIPDETAIGKVLTALDKNADVILAVGSGTINDISRYASFMTGKPYIIAGTAPSMDGYASTVSPLIVNHLKTTYEAVGPKAIVADTSVLKNAPMEMILAGLGDVLGKYTGLCDWKLSSIINNEYYCPSIVGMVQHSIKKCAESAPGLLNRDEEAMRLLTEGLVLTGIAMSFAGNSRPASGCEHHVAHYLEMQNLFVGKRPQLHGADVGVGEIAMLKLYELLRHTDIDFGKAERAAREHDTQKWESDVHRLYQTAAQGVLDLERSAGKNCIPAHAARIRDIREKWEDITKTIDEMIPDISLVEGILANLGAPINPVQLGYDCSVVRDAAVYCKELRNRYCCTQLAWDLGILEELADGVQRYFESGQRLFQNLQTQREQEILKDVKCFVLDMDGTFYLENRILPGAKEFLSKVEKSGREFYFYTNNSSKNAEFYLERLRKMDVVIDPSRMLISNEVIIEHCKKHYAGKSFYVVGTPYLMQDFLDAGLTIHDDGDVVVLGFDTTLTYEKLENACRLIRNGAPFLAVNPDFNCPVENGFIPDCGSMSALVTASTGVKPEFFGKPSAHTLRYVMERTGFAEHEIAFVGDRLYTDIAIGQGNNAVTILVLTGETKKGDLKSSPFKPSLVFESIGKIPLSIVKNKQI